MRIYTERDNYGRNIRLAIILRETTEGGIDVVMPFQVQHFGPDQAVPIEAAFSFEGDKRKVNELLQAFLDHAWERGLRPAGFADTTEQVRAMGAHLEDMRSLVFKGQVKPRGAE